jgi:endonuclease/exonuclease/phosphatase family metal-dependent hydrolase
MSVRVSHPVRFTVALSLLALVVGLLIVATPGAHAARPVLRVCAANIQNTPDMPDRRVRADAAEVRAHCDVVLWQEIGERADHRAVQGRGWKSTRHRKGGVVVSWRTSRVAAAAGASWVRVSSPTPRCANGRPSYNPARWIVRKPLRARATGQRFTAVSLHFPQRRTCRTEDTRKRWSQAWTNTRRALPAGPVVVGGDWNRREGEIRGMLRGQHWITPRPRALDHVMVARSGWLVRARISRDLWSDHRLTGAVMVL